MKSDVARTNRQATLVFLRPFPRSMARGIGSFVFDSFPVPPFFRAGSVGQQKSAADRALALVAPATNWLAGRPANHPALAANLTVIEAHSSTSLLHGCQVFPPSRLMSQHSLESVP